MHLSVVFTSRNDDYNGDYLRRLSLSIKSLELVLHNVDWELILVDYNPVQDRPKLHEIYKSERIRHMVFSEEQHRNLIIRHLDCGASLILDNKILTRDEILSITPMMAGIGNNFALANNKSDYILCTSTDNIFTLSLADIVQNAEPNILYRSHRKNIPAEMAENLFDTIVNERPFRLKSMDKMNEKKNRVNKATGDFLLMDRNSWHKIGGYLPICHVRPKEQDSLVLWYACLHGLDVRCVPSCLVNIHKDVPHDRQYLLKQMNYIMSSDRLIYNHFSELDSVPYYNFRHFFRDKDLGPGKVYSYRDEIALERSKQVIAYFKSMGLGL